MSLCAGYFGGAPKLNREKINELVENYCIRVGIPPADSIFQNAMDKTGGQICLYSKKAFSYPYFIKDAQGNVLMILGFLRQEIPSQKSKEQNEILHRAVRE